MIRPEHLTVQVGLFFILAAQYKPVPIPSVVQIHFRFQLKQGLPGSFAGRNSR